MFKTTILAVLIALLFVVNHSNINCSEQRVLSWVGMETHSMANKEMKVPNDWIPLEKLYKDSTLLQNVLFKGYSHAIKIPHYATHLNSRAKKFMDDLQNTLQLIAQDHYYDSNEYLERLVNVTVALKQRNIHVLKKRFEKVTDPKHPEWTNYWTMKFVGKLTRPSTFSNETVISWLAQHFENGLEITNITAHGDYINVRAPIRVLNEMLNTVMIPFVHKEAPHRHGIIFRSHNAKYNVPSHIAPHIDFVNNVVQFPQIRRLRVLKAEKRPRTQIVPSFILQQYNATQFIPNSISKANRQAVVQLLYQYYSPDDLNAFFQNFVNNAQPAPVRTVGDQNDPTNPGDEASLDIEYIMGVGQNIKTDFIVSAAEDPLVDWIQLLQQQGDDSAFVQSTSYGGNEPAFTKNYVTRMSNEIMKLGITGRTVLYSSGDDGVTCSDDGNSFVPDFPGTIPYLTTVGATQPIEDASGRAVPAERASDTFSSGGGFSNYFPIADYQTEHVKGYLSQMRSRGQLPPTSFFNSSGRAYPDIAAYGVSFTIVLNGQAGLVDGTSASTPTFAALVSLMNEERLKRGMKPLGFLNNWLYSVVYKTTGALRDVVIGSNPDDPCPGFQATHGWDPVTGLGTPNIRVMMSLALKKSN